MQPPSVMLSNTRRSTTPRRSALRSSSFFPSRFEVGLPVGRDVMFMKVCAEGRKTASSDWMSLITLHYALQRGPAPTLVGLAVSSASADLLSLASVGPWRDFSDFLSSLACCIQSHQLCRVSTDGIGSALLTFGSQFFFSTAKIVPNCRDAMHMHSIYTLSLPLPTRWHVNNLLFISDKCLFCAVASFIIRVVTQKTARVERTRDRSETGQ